MPSWQSHTIEANGLKLHYTRTGGAKHPLLLLHGVTDDGLCWTPIAEALQAEYDVIMLDARGHGRSQAPEQGYGPAAQAEDLAAVIAALGLRRPLVLGHSMGAATTLAFAGSYPEVPAAIVLEDPPMWWLASSPEAEAAAPERQAGMRAWIEGLRRKTREELIAEQRAAAPAWPEAELGPWADSKLRFSLNILSVFSPANAAGVDWATIAPRVACPALLVTADPALGGATTPDGAAALKELVPQLQVAHIPAAGHNIRRDQPARFLEVVRAFLASPGAGS
jgi:pimeloyl-ACP methyl ester carboxylesterase